MDVTFSLERMGETERSNSPGASRPGMAQISAWFVPNLAVMVCVFTLFFCLFLFDGPQKLFRDSDTGWHIRTGESILRGEGFPHTDTYSLLRTGEPWFAWESLADSVMIPAYRLDLVIAPGVPLPVCRTECNWL